MNKKNLIYHCKCGKKIKYRAKNCLSCSKITHGETLKKHYCLCGQEISDYRKKSCRKCADKIHSLRMIKLHEGKNNFNWKGGKPKCMDCGKEISYEAIRCTNCRFKGKLSPNYKGGITDLGQLIRNLDEYDNWRISIFIRDNHVCQECGDNKSYNLNAHHIITFAKLIEEFLQFYNQFSPIEDKETLARLAITWQPFWNLNNGKSLCKKCHKKIEVLK